MGNTRYHTKDNGQSYAELEYDVWGNPTSPNMLLNNDNGVFIFAVYTGHIYDTVLDIYFAEARFLDAKNRQWMNSDPMKDGLNWYQYVRANPATWIDPWGLMVAIYPDWESLNHWGEIHNAVLDYIVTFLNPTGSLEKEVTLKTKSGTHRVDLQEKHLVGSFYSIWELKPLSSLVDPGRTEQEKQIQRYLDAYTELGMDALKGGTITGAGASLTGSFVYISPWTTNAYAVDFYSAVGGKIFYDFYKLKRIEEMEYEAWSYYSEFSCKDPNREFANSEEKEKERRRYPYDDDILEGPYSTIPPIIGPNRDRTTVVIVI